MKPKTLCKIAIDFFLTIGLLLLMAYELIGEAVHEWIGTGVLLLCILHHILNWNWISHLLKGNYTAYRILQTIVTAFVFLSIVGLMISGIILSRHVFAFLPISDGHSVARTLHMLCAYWGFVLMSAHMGLHLHMLRGVMRKVNHIAKLSMPRTIFLRTIGLLIAAYGMYAFFQRQIGSYLFLQNEFVFFDFNEPLIAFFADYLAIMGLFACVGYYISKLLRLQGR
ncbi:hypothetical protein AXX12_13310 [Anaerosporomusa subterranea]|uniref:Uncharacterized protein n=1 Tax=Anaerosporomusa subterranea TaxID=1794912 RepID=A0A154BME8_ANASB|nr:DUF4405 domain-containing protein [Anaerosporomusa subterranea]KYZ75149.1 hypothetical protein AXX12_13310 [Anaerosporomusa subterranea]